MSAGLWRHVLAAASFGCLAWACGAPGEPVVPPDSTAAPPATIASRALGGAPATAEGAERPAAFRTATGTLRAYDPPTRLLTIEAASGSSTYRVAADARAWIGSRRLPVAELRSYLGAQATLAFAQDETGARTTHTVRLANEGALTRSR